MLRGGGCSGPRTPSWSPPSHGCQRSHRPPAARGARQKTATQHRGPSSSGEKPLKAPFLHGMRSWAPTLGSRPRPHGGNRLNSGRPPAPPGSPHASRRKLPPGHLNQTTLRRGHGGAQGDTGGRGGTQRGVGGGSTRADRHTDFPQTAVPDLSPHSELADPRLTAQPVPRPPEPLAEGNEGDAQLRQALLHLLSPRKPLSDLPRPAPVGASNRMASLGHTGRRESCPKPHSQCVVTRNHAHTNPMPWLRWLSS